MGVLGKPHHEYDESLMGQNKLHPKTTRGTVEQHPNYSSATSRRKNPQKSSATAIYTTTAAGLRRDIIIRGYIIDINIQIFLLDTRYRRGAREVALMRRAIEASTSTLDSSLLDDPNPNIYIYIHIYICTP